MSKYLNIWLRLNSTRSWFQSCLNHLLFFLLSFLFVSGCRAVGLDLFHLLETVLFSTIISSFLTLCWTGGLSHSGAHFNSACLKMGNITRVFIINSTNVHVDMLLGDIVLDLELISRGCLTSPFESVLNFCETEISWEGDTNICPDVCHLHSIIDQPPRTSLYSGGFFIATLWRPVNYLHASLLSIEACLCFFI